MPSNEFVRCILKEWKLEQLIDVFEEHEIDEEAFWCLNSELIKSLIPKIGPQTKFLSNWSKKLAKEQTNIQAVANEVIIFENIDETAATLDTTVPVTTVLAEVPTEGTPDQLPIRSGATSTNSCISSISTCSMLPNCLNTSEDLRLLLKTSVEGLVVLNTYEHQKEFTNQLRLHLANAIISYEIAKSPDFRITSGRLTEIANLIQQTFATEKAETYYIPFATNSVTNRRVLAKGKLYDKYCANRAYLRQSGAIISKRKRTGNTNPFVLGFRENLRSIEDSEGYTEKVEWLKNCLEPWPTVELYWGDTSKARLENLLASDSITSTQYLTTFKVLRQPCGYNLFHIDFARMYPEKSITLYVEWSKFEKQIIEYIKAKKSKDAPVKALFSLISDTNKSNDTGNIAVSSAKARAAIILRILPLLLPCPQIKTKNKALWRVSKAEIQNSFFLHVTSIAELDSELANHRRKLSLHGLPEQPLPVVVGSSLDNIETCCVCINDIKYFVDSPLAALDTTFKSFYALQLQYPREAEYPWLIIQQHLYKILAEDDRTLPAVLTLIADLVRQSDD